MGSILERNYAERRIVVVAPTDRNERKASGTNWNALLAAGAVPLFGSPGGILLSMVVKWLAQRRKAPKGTLIVPLEVATKELLFTPGHPLLDHAYVGHPLDGPRYTPLASFHNYVFDQKVNDLVTLLASLGAERLRVRFRQGYRSAAGFHFEANIPGQAGTVEAGGKAERHSNAEREALIEETYSSKCLPSIPAGLVWFEHEPSWQALARRRLEFGTKTFSTILTYTDDYGVNAELKVGLEKFGVKMGGSFTSFQATEWAFEGTFAPT